MCPERTYSWEMTQADEGLIRKQVDEVIEEIAECVPGLTRGDLRGKLVQLCETVVLELLSSMEE